MPLIRLIDNIILNSNAYRNKYNIRTSNAWHHYNKYGFNKLLNPSLLIDPLYIFASNPTYPVSIRSLKILLRQKIKPHSLFNIHYYEKQVSQTFNSTLSALKYFYTQEKKISPSPHFCFDKYNNLNPDVANNNHNPLLHYLEYGKLEQRTYSNNYTDINHNFAKNLKWNKTKTDGLTFLEIEMYIKEPIILSYANKYYAHETDLNNNTDALFDPFFYLSTYNDLENLEDPYWHFLEHGLHEGRKPNPLYDPKFISNKYNVSLNKDNIFNFYRENNRTVNPHPLFESNQVYNHYQNEIDALKVTPLEYFLIHLNHDKYIPTKLFDSDHYLSQLSTKPVENPLLHYIKQGNKSPYSPTKTFDRKYYLNINNTAESKAVIASISMYSLYLQNRSIKISEALYNFNNKISRFDPNRPTLLFISHDGSRTGAPLIIYHLCKYYTTHFPVNAINIILRKGGTLASSFKSIAPTYEVSDFNNELLYNEEINSILDQIESSELYAFVNSAESRSILPLLRAKNIYTLSLIHEMAHYYPKSEWQIINDFSDKILFPSTIVRKYAQANSQFDKSKIHVRGQGIFPDKVLSEDIIRQKHALHRQHGLPFDTFIVLGCGTMNYRKGVDLFVSSAISYFHKHSFNDIAFIWLGDTSDQELEFANSLRQLVIRSRLEEHILFIPSTPNTSLYFNGADMFFMSSRADPFPCVVLEAIEYGLPVMYFKDTGGYEEILNHQEYTLSTEVGNISETIDIISEIKTNSIKKDNIIAYQNSILKDTYTYDNYVKFINQIILSQPANKSLFTNAINQSSYCKKAPVLFTIDDYWISGVNTVIINTIRGLIKLKENPILVVTKIIPPTHISDIPDDIPLHILELESNNQSEIKSKFLEYILAFESCTILPHTDYLISSLSKNLIEYDNIKVIGVLHSDDEEHYDHGYIQGRYWNHIVCVSTIIKDKLIKLNPTFINKTSVILNGISATQNTSIVQKFDDIKCVELCYVGRIIQFQKRILDFDIVIQKLREKGIRFHLTIIGDGPEFTVLQNLLSDKITNGTVTLTGKINTETIQHYLEKCHFITLLSDFEGLPMALLEGMSKYCIPLVSDINSGLNEILDNTNSIIFPIGQYDVMVDKLDQFLRLSNSERKIISLKTHETLIKRRLTTDDMASQYKKIIYDTI